MGVAVTKLRDLVNWTRVTEYRQGGYVDLSEPLPDYPLWMNLLQREVIKSTPQVRYQLVTADESSEEVVEVGDPVQVSPTSHSNSVTLNWCKRRNTTVWYPDEEAFNGIGSPEGIVDVVATRKTQFDAEPRRATEVQIAGDSVHATKDDIIPLRSWLPPSSSATDLELNGGADVSTKEYSGPTVAEIPEWGHAVCGFDVIENDLLFKIDEFMDRVNYFAPDGSKNIIPGSPNRIGLLNHKIYSEWKDLQTIANDNLQDDLGMWRAAVHFRSVPFINLPAWTEPQSAAKPSGEALVSVLDLNAIKFWIHSDFNFKLYPAYVDFHDGGVKLKRERYTQLAFLSRRNHLMARTTNAAFLM